MSFGAQSKSGDILFQTALSRIGEKKPQQQTIHVGLKAFRNFENSRTFPLFDFEQISPLLGDSNKNSRNTTVARTRTRSRLPLAVMMSAS